MDALVASGPTEMDDNDQLKFTVEFSPDELNQIAESVEFHIKFWPGYPAAPKEEQEMLLHLRMILRLVMMEVSFQRGKNQSR